MDFQCFSEMVVMIALLSFLYIEKLIMPIITQKNSESNDTTRRFAKNDVLFAEFFDIEKKALVLDIRRLRLFAVFSCRNAEF